MNILIIGEWSGFAKHLKDGFLSFGHNVIILAPGGDGFKQIQRGKYDIYYKVSKNIMNIRGSHYLMNPLFNIILDRRIGKIKIKFDIIFIINEIFTRNNIFDNVAISINRISKLRNKKSCCILSSCGRSVSYTMFGQELRYYKISGRKCNYTKREVKYFNHIINNCDCIVPEQYDYFYCIKKYCEQFNVKIPIYPILIPITIEKEYKPLKIKNKIVILHGVIREKEKGSNFIIPALNRIAIDYPNKVEIIIDGKMPYKDYIKLLDRCDILLDETNSYGFGVNAAIGLMKGKVVFAGNEKESIELFNNIEVPIINLIPDIDYIYNKLKDLILNPLKIEEIGLKSRAFAEKYISSTEIARQYIDIYEKKINEI